MPDDPFAHSIYYLHRKRSRGRQKPYWAFTFHDALGTPLLEAHIPEIPKEVVLFVPGDPDCPLLRLKAWRWFWWNGCYDVLDAGGTVLATLRRTGGIEGPDRCRIGRVRNATPLKKSMLHLFTLGFLDLLFSQGEDSFALLVNHFRVEAGVMEIGSLRRERLPFSIKPGAEEVRDASGPRRWIGWIRSVLRNRWDSRGWLIDFSADGACVLDPRVRVAAALFRIQIEERY